MVTKKIKLLENYFFTYFNLLRDPNGPKISLNLNFDLMAFLGSKDPIIPRKPSFTYTWILLRYICIPSFIVTQSNLLAKIPQKSNKISTKNLKQKTILIPIYQRLYIDKFHRRRHISIPTWALPYRLDVCWTEYVNCALKQHTCTPPKLAWFKLEAAASHPYHHVQG